MKKLGPHGIHTTADAAVWASRAPVVKQVGSTALLANAHAHAVRIYRRIFDDQRLDQPVQPVADALLAGLEGYRHPLLFVEVFVGVPGSAWREHLLFLQKIAPVLHEAGVGVCGPSWYTGDFEREAWEGFRAGGWAGLDLIAFQAYWSTAGFTRWNALRHRQFWQPGDPKVVITECFRDQVRDGPNGTLLPREGPGDFGYRAQGLTDEQALAELDAYDAELQQDDEVIGATPFTTGPTDDWRNKGFDLDPIAARLALRSDPPAAAPVIRPPEPHPQEPTVDLIAGIDVSNWQGQPDWDEVILDQRRPRFAIAKACEDGWGIDPTFSRNWSETARVGLGRGAYAFVRPALRKPAESVDLLLRALEGSRYDPAEPGVIACDAEDDPVNDTAGWLLDWAGIATERTGKVPALYSGEWWMRPNGLLDARLADVFWLWLAAWQNEAPAVPAGWQRYVIWQHGAGPVRGIQGDVDLNYFVGAQLAPDLSAPALPAPIPPTPPMPAYSFDLPVVRADFDQLWSQTEELAHQGRRKTRAIAMQRTIGRIKTDLKIA